MNTFKLNNSQLMMMPDELAYDLKLIQEPPAVEVSHKVKFLLLGATLFALTLIVIQQINYLKI